MVENKRGKSLSYIVLIKNLAKNEHGEIRKGINTINVDKTQKLKKPKKIGYHRVQTWELGIKLKGPYHCTTQVVSLVLERSL